MTAIGDDPAPTGVVVERASDGAGCSASKLRHGVEQMRESAQPGGERRCQLFVARIGMACETSTPASVSAAIMLGFCGLGRQRQHCLAALERGDERKALGAQYAEIGRVVNAFPFRV